MKDSTRNSLVGFFVLASLACLASLMVMFGEKPTWLGGQQWELKISGLREIRGIAEGTPVFLNGVEIGRVARLEFNNPNRPGLGVRVICHIKDQYTVPARSIAKLYGAALGLGGGSIHILVDPGSDMAQLPRDAAEIRGEPASLFSEIITRDFLDSFERTVDHIGNLASAATPVMDSLEKLLQERRIIDVDNPDAGMAANFSTMIERVDALVANVNEVLGDENVQEDVKSAARDLKSTAESLKATAELWNSETVRLTTNVNEAIDKTEANLDRSFDKLQSTLESLDESARQLTLVMGGISRGEGTIGLLAKDPRLYEEAVLALQRLADVLASIGRITGKVERDGHITIGQTTAVGTFTKDFPVGEKAKE
jgi:hypothetical protein